MNNHKSLDFYLKLPYQIVLEEDLEVGGYTAYIEELPGCITQGETLDETIENIHEAKELWLEIVFEQGEEIPYPKYLSIYSINK
jgi:predicted RNase H-like HicB family nuclease